MIKWFWAKITGGKLVWLKDHDGEVTKSIAYESPFGGLTAQRYWPFKIRCVELLPDALSKGVMLKIGDILIKLTKQSINKIYQDSLGNEYLVLQEVKSCCRMPYYLLNEVGTINEYPYDSIGRRFDHRFKVDVNNRFNLV